MKRVGISYPDLVVEEEEELVVVVVAVVEVVVVVVVDGVVVIAVVVVPLLFNVIDVLLLSLSSLSFLFQSCWTVLVVGKGWRAYSVWFERNRHALNPF